MELCRKKDLSQDLVDKKLIGEGGYGKVYSAWDPVNKRKVAIKEVLLDDSCATLLSEIVLLKESRHPNIIRLYDCYVARDSDGRQLVCLVMEFADCGNLADAIASLFGANPSRPFSEEIIAYICQESLKALKLLHGQGIIHRDIKSDNLLVNSDGEVKLADFGFAAELESSSQKRKTYLGTPYWMASELIRSQPYDCKVDIWSLGVIIIELVDRDPPYFDHEPLRALFQIVSKGVHLRHPQRVSRVLLDFFRHCTEIDPEKRFSADQLLEHPFLEKACSRERFSELMRKFKTIEEQKRSGSNDLA